jgi:hypothetical protein
VTKSPKLSPDEQTGLDDRLLDAAVQGDADAVRILLATGANVHAQDDRALDWAARDGHTETVKALLAAGANVRSGDDGALRAAASGGHTETVRVLLAHGANVGAHDNIALCWATVNGDAETTQVLAKHIFTPESWRGKSHVVIETEVNALYDKIKTWEPLPERLRQAGVILANCALRCWEQVRPAPPKLKISPLPAQPRPL